MAGDEEELDTETKLAILASSFHIESQEDLLEILIREDGDLEKALEVLETRPKLPPIADEDVECPPTKRPRLETVAPDTAPTKQKSLSSVLKWTPSAEPPPRVCGIS